MGIAKPVADEGFTRFWTAYPRHDAKAEALKAWVSLKPSPALIDTMLTALRWQVTQVSWQKDGGEYVPYAASWLRGRRWEDERRQTVRPVSKAGQEYLEQERRRRS